MQPSVNDIASLYRGNPQALQARMQKEPQLAPGIPADLKQLLALNIVTNEENGMARQQAMQQLNQMAPQGEGQMPTIAQSIQEQAKQKLQAQMMQQQQQQQAMQQMASQMRAGSVPPGTPQPQRQPQGIDELPAEFSLAGGGIVAFEEGGRTKYETRYDRMTRENRGELTEEERATQEARDALIAQIPSGGPTVTGGERVDSSETERNIRNILSALPGAGAAKATTLGRQALAGISSLLGMDRSNAPDEARAPARVQAPQTAEYSNEGRTGARPYPSAPAPAPVRDLKQLAAQRQQAAPTPETATPTGTPGTASPMSSLFQEGQALQAERMRAIPEAGAANKEAGYQSRVAAPDFTQRDAMIKLLQEERGRQAEPKEGWGSLMEYLGQIAATPRGMTSFEAGAAGARGQAGLQEQRAQKRFDLGTKIIEQEQGKIDASRAYAEKVYGIGEKEYDRIYKEKLDAAMQITKDEMEARKMAQQETLKLLELKQQATLDREKMRSNEKIAGMRGAGGMGAESKEIVAAEAAFARDPEAKALMKTMEAFAMSPGNPKAVQAAARLREIQASKYKQFGLTLEGAPGAPRPGGTSLKYNPATGKIE